MDVVDGFDFWLIGFGGPGSRSDLGENHATTKTNGYRVTAGLGWNVPKELRPLEDGWAGPTTPRWRAGNRKRSASAAASADGAHRHARGRKPQCRRCAAARKRAQGEGLARFPGAADNQQVVTAGEQGNPRGRDGATPRPERGRVLYFYERQRLTRPWRSTGRKDLYREHSEVEGRCGEVKTRCAKVKTRCGRIEGTSRADAARWRVGVL